MEDYRSLEPSASGSMLDEVAPARKAVLGDEVTSFRAELCISVTIQAFTWSGPAD